MGSVNIPVAAVVGRFRERLTRGLADAGEVVVDEVRRTIVEDPKTGRWYPWLPNRSSKWGETPRYQFGVLSAGLVVDANEDRAMITSYAPYSANLEYHMGRAFMRPSLAIKYNDIIAIIAGAINGSK